MTIKGDEYKSVVGIANAYYALITQDDSGGYVVGTPKRLGYATELSREPKTESKTQYADNMPFDALSSEGATEMKVKVTSIPAATYAEILGRTFDATTGRVYDNNGTPPFVALGFETEKSNGKSRYYWYLKGRFSPPSESAATKTESAEYQELEIPFTAIATTHQFDLGGSVTDSVRRVWGDEDTESFSATNWFSQVQVPGVSAVSALALSSSNPAANATGVVVSANVVLTFNNALATGEEGDIVLVTAAGAQVACATTIDAARKVVTLDPSSNMTAATVHIVSYAVKDIYGQTLAGVLKFTTA